MLNEKNILISKIKNNLLNEKNISLDILRLDLLHPHISGNKWYKLKYNIEQALLENKQVLLSFGGAYSNHLHALAYAGFLKNIKTIGIIRGEKIENDTLKDCKKWGMDLYFISREEYRLKNEKSFLQKIKQKFSNAYIIPEGGGNVLGAKGCEEILTNVDSKMYEIVCCAVGTGTTLAGIINSSKSKKVLGFCALKNGEYLKQDIEKFTQKKNWELIHSYHFGGFAKTNSVLMDFIKKFEFEQNFQLDVIYTSKMIFGVLDMIEANIIREGSKILVIHSGGLQGNRSTLLA